MNRLLIERIEGRVLLGITMFVSIMILIGWVVINEPSRMAAVEELNLGRSIERGAELFAANCSTCHGTDGRGQAGRAPALNNPHLFGFDYLSNLNNEIGLTQRRQADLLVQIDELNAEREELFTEAGAGADAERLAEIQERIPAIDEQISTFQAEVDQITADLEPLIAERETQLDSLQPAVDAGYLPGLEAARTAGGLELTNFLQSQSSRLSQAGWGGDVRSYLVTTLVHGRPGSGNVWGGVQMAAWSNLAGGPLRQDQIEDISNYILNWDQGSNWTLEDLYGVNQFAKLHADAELVSTGSDVPAAGTNTDVIQATIETDGIVGDPVRGEALYTGQTRTELNARLGCSSCHEGGAQAPATADTWTNTNVVRLADSANSGKTAEYYIIESIVAPNEYVVPGYSSGIMPQQFGAQMSVQDVADVLEYLKSFGS